ncbi:MAG: flagellar filament capping protein FliD [Phycisphaerales bacterium]
MGGISTSVGPFSGIDTGALIEQLLAIESRPKQLAQARVATLQAQRAAYLDVNSALLALKTSAASFRADKIFKSAKAVSSHPDALTATAGTTASPGVYQFTVARLVSTQQQLSRGFASRDQAAVGLTQLSVEIGGGRLDTETLLSSLNGGQGVARGKIKITDREGETATIDLSTAVSVDDVLTAINNNGSANVEAVIEGDRITIVDRSGGAGTLKVQNAAGYTTATSLGIEGNGATITLAGASSGTVTGVRGSRVNYLSAQTSLASLNDGNGVTLRNGVGAGVADFEIVARDGTLLKIELGERKDNNGNLIQTAAATLQEVVDRINNTTGNGGKVTASIDATSNRLVLSDSTGGGNNLIVREVSTTDPSRTTARDLGLLTDAAGVASSTHNGRRILAGINDTLASNLNGGIRGAGSGGLSGGGTFQITRRDGFTYDLTVNENDSVRDIINRINETGGGVVTASLNSTGNGLRIVDTSSGGGSLVITDQGGSAAASLGIATLGRADGIIDSGNLQTRYLSGASKLADLNGRTGVGTGQFRIYNSNGVSTVISVDSNDKTLDDVIRKINASSGVVARINDTGDGLLLTDASSGSLAIRVEDESGVVARKLNLVGSGDLGAGNTINGTFERTIEFAATDTLNQIVEKINAAGVGVTANVLVDASSGSPFRLSLTSKYSGAVGRSVIDTDGFNLGLSTLTKGRDAVAFFGSGDPANAALLTSSTNTLDNAITGVTVDLRQTTTSPVTLTVSRDVEKIVDTAKTFVSAFNTILDKIKKYDSYDADTNKRGTLLGDSTLAQVRSAIYRVVQGSPLNVSARYTNLSQVGFRVGAGGKLELDETKFRDAHTQDPQAVEDLLAAFGQDEPSTVVLDPNGEPIPGASTSGNTQATYNTLGVAEQLAVLMNQLTNVTDGALTRRDKAINDQIELQIQRIGGFDAKLARKRARLETQFLAMEKAIASLRTQQSALGGISAVR